MIFEYNGVIRIDEGLELMNPKMEIMIVHYDITTNEFDLEIHFWELLKRHNRMFKTTNNAPGSLSMENVLDFVEAHPILGQFDLIV